MARRILITRELPEAALEFARRNLDVEIPEGNQALSREELLKRIRDKEGLVSLLTDTIDAYLGTGRPVYVLRADRREVALLADRYELDYIDGSDASALTRVIRLKATAS